MDRLILGQNVSRINAMAFANEHLIINENRIQNPGNGSPWTIWYDASILFPEATHTEITGEATTPYPTQYIAPYLIQILATSISGNVLGTPEVRYWPTGKIIMIMEDGTGSKMYVDAIDSHGRPTTEIKSSESIMTIWNRYIATASSALKITEVVEDWTTSGSTITHAIAHTPANNPTIQSKVKVYDNGILLNTTKYSVSGTTVTFTPAIATAHVVTFVYSYMS